jgi:nucleoside-diphosphate-sugar epimerase
MKVLLTGALGNVGEYTIKSLLDEGHNVVAFDLLTPAAQRRAAKLSDRVQIVWGNITDPSSVQNALDGVEAVIHLAGMVPPNVDKNVALSTKVNVGGTRCLIDLMEASTTAKRLIFASSVGVFGDVQNREPPLRADTPVSPTDEYGRQKVACENAIRSSSLQWTILRLGAAVPTRVLGSHYDPRAGFEISADARIEFIHPADAGLAFARAAGCSDAVGKILYVGGGKRCQMIALPFYNTLMDPIGIGPVPAEAFAKAEHPRFTGDWLDTDESQRLLQYQSRGMDELKEDLKNGLGALVFLIRMLRPFATWFYVRSSPYLKANRRNLQASNNIRP